MVRKLFITILTFFAALLSHAQTVRVLAPDSINAGDRFRVSYVIENCNVTDFDLEPFQSCTVISGPSTSRQSSYSMVNGQRIQKTSVTLTYFLQAQSSMAFVPAACTISSGGNKIRVKASEMTIEPTDLSGNPLSLSTVGDNDLFIRVSVSKKQVYQKETVVLTYKLYTCVDIKEIIGRLPQPENCYYQELGTNYQHLASQELIDGKLYTTSVWRQFMLIFNEEGKISVPSTTLDAEVILADYSSYDPFDMFFGGSRSTRTVTKKVSVPGFDIDVMPLPEPRPAGFSGAVGNYSITSQLNYALYETGDTIPLRFILSGQGNMNLMKAPVFDFPQDVEVYNQSKVHQNGYMGNVVYDYMLVPRKPGNYAVPQVEYIYFDPDKARYITIKTDQFHIQVE